MPLYKAASANLTALVAADGASGGFIKDSEAGNLPATATNDSASAGKLGESIVAELAAGSATGLTSTTAKTIASIALTAGDWDISANVIFVAASGTLVTAIAAGASQTDNTLPTAPAGGW